MKRKQIVSAQQVLFDVEKEVPPITRPKKEKKDDAYIFDIMDALLAPILTFSEAWADTIPKRLLNIIKVARIIALKNNEQLATFPECSVYIYTRTLESPMHGDWTDIYTHVSCKVCQDWFNEDHWEEVKAPKTLTDWQLSKLNQLRRHLYERRRLLLKKDYKTEKSIPPTDSKAQKVKRSLGNLPSLFSK